MLKAAQLTRLQLLYIVDVTPCLLNDGRPGLSMTNGGRLIVFPIQCSRGRGSFGQQVIDNLSLALCFESMTFVHFGIASCSSVGLNLFSI